MSEFMSVLTQAASAIYSPDVAIFSVAATILSLAVWALDRIHMVALRRPSALGVGTGGLRSLQSLFYWGFGAGVAAYLGGFAQLIDVDSSNAMLALGVGWPLILPRIVTLAGVELDPDQEFVDGGPAEEPDE